MKHDSAGDPMTGLKRTRRTTRRIAEELATLGIQVSKNTVGRLLQQIDYSLRVNRKQIASTKSPDRQQQFLYLGQLRQQFSRQAQPIISVDTKKKELVGRFKNSGVKWDRQPLSVNDHDFPSDAAGIAIPYGIYDLQPIAGRCLSAAVTKPPSSPLNASKSGGDGRARNPTRKPSGF